MKCFYSGLMAVVRKKFQLTRTTAIKPEGKHFMEFQASNYFVATGFAYVSAALEAQGFRMNSEKLKKLQSQVRIGGKGTPRRKKKVVHSTQATDDKKLQSVLKKLSVNTIPGIEEVNMIKDDGSVIHFNNPKTQASLGANTFAITGHGETKQITEMIPSILNQLGLGPEGISQLSRLASSVTDTGANKMVPEDDEDVPDLVENFDEASKAEVAKPQDPTADEKLKKSA